MSGIEILAWAGNAAFFSRFLVQWIASERAKRSVTPRFFWWLSLFGAVCIASYLTHQGEVVLLTGVVVNGGIYLRNLMLAYRSNAKPISNGLLFGGAVLMVAILVAATTGRVRATWSETPFWFLCSLVGQLIWSSRFVVQWFLSERRGESHLPRAFWWLSLCGNALLLSYAIHLADTILIAAYLPGPLVQVRNLMLSARQELKPFSDRETGRRAASDSSDAAAPPTAPVHDPSGTRPRHTARTQLRWRLMR